jgi:hypothetical protein
MMADWVYDFTLAKQGLANALGVSSSVLHVPLGFVIFAVLLRVFGATGRGAFWALLCLLFVQCFNEALDAVQWVRWTGGVNWTEALWDVLLTLALPALIAGFVGLRERRRLRLGCA